MIKRYHVRLSEDQRTELERLISRGKPPARVITRARILMQAPGPPMRVGSSQWSVYTDGQ
jgi:hypothetical protein